MMLLHSSRKLPERTLATVPPRLSVHGIDAAGEW